MTPATPSELMLVRLMSLRRYPQMAITIEVPEGQNVEDVRKALAESNRRRLISASMKTEVKIEAIIRGSGRSLQPRQS